MRLREFRVQGFKCIHDSGAVAVGDIAALVGKNESGKTALLEALTHLNKDASIAELDLCDEMHESLREGSVIVEGLFEFSDDEIAKFEKAFPSVQGLSKIRIARTYRSKAVTYDLLTTRIGAASEFVTEERPTFIAAVESLKVELGKAQEAALPENRTLEAEHRKLLDTVLVQLGKPEILSKAQLDQAMQLLAKQMGTKAQTSPFAVMLKALKDSAGTLYRPVDVSAQVRKYIFENFHPKFVYFSEYREIFGSVHLPTYLAGAESPAPVTADTGLSFDKKVAISNLFRLANLDPTHLETIKKNPQLRGRYLRECSLRLTAALAKTWKTQKIEIKLEYGIGDVLTVQISDVQADGTRTNEGHLSRRSQGFRWHFSFYVNFIAETRNDKLSEAILLLDEPAVHLHPAQQAGMLEVLKELGDSNQILYTTHSPFLIYDYNVGAILTVELDHLTHLSKISPIIWKGDPETIFPILQVLGAPLLPGLSEPALAPFSPPVLIVEGHTDLMYLIVLEQLSARRNQTPFRPRYWLQPAGGTARVAALAMFYYERAFRTFALFDKEPDAKDHASRLVQQGFPEASILFCDTDGRDESDVEDLFTQDDYLRAVNELYLTVLKDSKFSRIADKDVELVRRGDGSLKRIVPALEKLWESHEGDGWGRFDKAKVCAKIFQIANQDEKYPSEKSLGRFEKLLEDLYAKTDDPSPRKARRTKTTV
jgi:energy-coupling factor transporter ATP-binding protein EcfA2